MGGEDAADQLGKSLRHPAPVRQQLAGVGIDQNQALPRRIERRRCANAFEHARARFEARRRQRHFELIIANNGLGIGHRRRGGGECVDQRNEVLGDVQMRIIGDAMREHLAAIEPFIMKAVKADPPPGAAQAAQQRREARE